MEWTCRDECYWNARGAFFKKGETIETLGITDWAYSGGYWHPRPKDGEILQVERRAVGSTLIPRHFEPTLKKHAEIEDLANARLGIAVPPLYIILGIEPKAKTKEEILIELEREAEAEAITEQERDVKFKKARRKRREDNTPVDNFDLA